ADGQPDCVPPSIEHFPGDFMTQEQRQQGGVVLHFIIVIYLCGILGYICDDYFVPSLEIIADTLKVPSDVAGATFMAIGTSAPELFSSIIGSFITEGDIGVGTIVGSAVFNILGVTGVAGIAVWNDDIPIDWFPITRDCVMYAITVVALIGVISNNIVEWYEALILILMFLAYIVVLFFNAHIDIVSIIKITYMLLNTWFTATAIALVAEPCETNRRDKQQESVWYMPREGSVGQVLWVLFWPVRFLLHFTVPDCRKESLRRWYSLTFILSVVWIGGVSYLTVWMVTIIGYTIGIPDSVAGITVLAAGTSVPEVFSSVIVARNGLGNMAICNLLGSNIFDVLFCLGVPWFLKAVFASRSHEVFINSAAMTYTSVTLLSTVALLFGTFVITRWKLNYKVGFACIIMYIIFITLACMYELNVFGDFNPPTCT
ncbi:unnamed protein product, partial [Ixodes persulcatus]